jgi:hypothetical protein
MSQTIRVEQLLRESVVTPYSDLVTRSTGRAVRSSIQAALAQGEETRVVLLDFSDVGLVDLSCADEIIAKLLLDPPGQVYLILVGLREEQLEAIEQVLEHHDLAALVTDPSGVATFPVGRVSADLRTAFFTLQSVGTATPQVLAERMDWTVTRAAEELETLLRLRLVRASDGCYTVPLTA